MERIGTGIPALDRILGGGLPVGSTVVLAGPPGTGKTILAQQIAFNAATPERPARYYTTLSEPHAKLIRHLEPFRFFDRSALGQRISYLHLTELAQAAAPEGRGLDRVVEEIVESAFEVGPSLVVVDSAKALHHFGDDDGLRETIFALASRVAHTGTVLLLVGEYTEEEMEQGAEFAVADGIIQVANQREGPTDRRWLRVLKMRGTDYLTGQHTFELSDHGYDLLPRLEAVSPRLADTQLHHTRHAFGLPAIDEMTGGGLPAGDASLVMGPSGVGKTALASHWIQGGLDAGESCLYVALEETRRELLDKADSFGLRFREAVVADRLQILEQAPSELDIDRFGMQLAELIEQWSPTRIAIDSLGELLIPAKRADRFPGYLWALTASLRASGASAMFTHELVALGAKERRDSLSYLFHDVLVLRYMERGSELGRILTVLKMRRSQHAKGLLEFQITSSGLTPVGEVDVVTGVLGGTVIGSATGNV